MESSVPPTPVATCSNCLYPSAVPVPFICSECGAKVVRPYPDLDDFPLSWTKRLIWLGWPLAGWTIGWILAELRQFGSLAEGLLILSCLAAPFNSFLVLVPIFKRPPRFILDEPPDRARRRHRLTMILTLGLSIAVPLLIAGSCWLKISKDLQRIRLFTPARPTPVPATTPAPQ
ncbi:MAG: hypothetical protein NTV94_11295 [Planctomycetota bacterium]|nr:hypothetical protein [Planctomycetota bacterium]